MRVEVQSQIVDELERSEDPLTFEEMQKQTELRAQDLRSGLKELIHSNSGVYVYGVEDKEKQYTIR